MGTSRGLSYDLPAVKRATLIEELSAEAHIWLTSPTGVGSVASFLEMLAPEEVSQYRRFLVDSARDQYLVARVLARSVLSRYMDVDPADWSFRLNKRGRPEVDGPPGLPPLRFNLSHTDGLVACLVTLELDAGVDVEETTRRVDVASVAKHNFSALEAAEVRNRVGRDQRMRFFSYWTLKEAYIKARGMGRALPLSRFSFNFPEARTVEVRFDPSLGDCEDSWQFHLWRASPSHLLAAAIHRGNRPHRSVIIRRSTPLADSVETLRLELVASSSSGS